MLKGTKGEIRAGERGVTPLMVEQQGERENRQNENCDGLLSVVGCPLSQMTNAPSAETVDDQGAGVVEASSAGDTRGVRRRGCHAAND